MRQDASFEFGEPQIQVQDNLKDMLIKSPALKAIDYISMSPVILTVNTSHIVIGFFLCQCTPENPKVWTYNHFGLLTLNE
jgi:hypothetical protein